MSRQSQPNLVPPEPKNGSPDPGSVSGVFPAMPKTRDTHWQIALIESNRKLALYAGLGWGAWASGVMTAIAFYIAG